MKRIVISAIAGLVTVGASALSACSSPAVEKPATPAPAVQPTEKALIPPPPKAFSQNMNAADGIAALESEGYNVEINWGVGKRNEQNLSLCRISDVSGLRGSGATVPGTTVYLTVVC
jgi:hypothetical protein